MDLKPDNLQSTDRSVYHVLLRANPSLITPYQIGCSSHLLFPFIDYTFIKLGLDEIKLALVGEGA